MTTSGTERRRCLPPWTSPPGGCWPSVGSGTATRSFLAFLRLIDREVPAELDVHLVLDNYATHKHAKVRQWLAGGAAAFPPALHVHLRFLVEPSGAVVLVAQPAGGAAISACIPWRRSHPRSPTGG